jgi:hypothetical protein
VRLNSIAARHWPSIRPCAPAHNRRNQRGDGHADDDRAVDRIRLSMLGRLVKGMGEERE